MMMSGMKICERKLKRTNGMAWKLRSIASWLLFLAASLLE
jgi:hypothetical protein